MTMKKILFSISLIALFFTCAGQEISQPEFDGQSCTSIMVGKRASKDGSVIKRFQPTTTPEEMEADIESMLN
jgi:hypothetical protein